MKNFIILLFFVVIASLAFADNYTYIKGSQLVESNQAIVSDTTETQLGATSPMITVVTGTNTHSIKLPSTASINVGFSYKIINKSTGIVTVKDFSDVVLSTIATNLESTFILFADGWKISTGGGSGGGGKELSVISPLQITQDTDSATISLGTIDYLDFNTATTPTAFDGRVHFDQDDKTLSIDVDSANGVKLQVGQEEYIRAVNKTGLQINDGQVVYINGAQGNRPTIQLAKADALDQSMIIGVATQNIAINAEGMITTYGVVGNYNTSGFSAGDKLYLSASASGTLTNSPPTSPNKVVRVAVALNSTNNGKILVNPKVTLDADSSLSLNSDLIAPTQKAIKSYVDAGLALKADDISAQMKDFTGFVDPSAVIVSYNSTTRQVSIGGTTTAYWRGKPVSLDSTFPAHANSFGAWYLSYDGGTGTVTWSNTPWTFDKLQIAVVQYQTSYKYGTREPHGMNLGWNSHKEFHETIGTYLSSGGDLSSYVLSSTTAANRRPDVSTATINDEDIPTVHASLTSKLYTRFSLSGAGSTAGFTTGSSDIVSLSGNQPYYNQFTGGAWQQTLMSNNNYQALWLVAIPVSSDAGSQEYRYIWIQGQSQSPTLSTIQGLTPNDISLGTLATQSPEYVFIGKIIIQYTAANWTITSVQKLTGNRFNQTGSPAGTYLSSVSTDSTLTGSGGVLDPLKVAIPLTATQSALLANTTMTSGYLPKYDGSGLVNSTAYETATGIGVGTATPSSKFESYESNSTTGAANGITIEQGSTGDASLHWLLTAGQRYTMGIDNSDSDKLKIGTSADLASNNLVTIDSAGNMGIGTTTPSVKLEVSSTATGTSTPLAISNLNPSGSADAVYFNPKLANNVGTIFSAGGQIFTKEQSWISGDNSTLNSAYRLFTTSNGSTIERVRVNSAGKMGINTTSPNARLMVSDSSGATETVALSFHSALSSVSNLPAYGIGMGPTSSEGYLSIRGGSANSTNNGIKLTVNDSEKMRVNGLGYVGIGTSSPTNLLTVSGSTTTELDVAKFINSNSGGYTGVVIDRIGNNRYSLLKYATNGVNDWYVGTAYGSGSANSSYSIGTTSNVSGSKLLITTTGNVGIGTTTPEATLHVAGDTVATGYQYFGSPTADGSFRMYVSGGALITEKRISGVWTELSRVDEL